jgi:hypothetical protein
MVFCALDVIILVRLEHTDEELPVSTEIATLAATAVPYVAAAVGAYGSSVLERLQDAAADATVGLGGRILTRLLGNQQLQPAIEGAVVELAEDTADEDRIAALRLQIRKALAADPQLAADIAEELRVAGPSVVASGDRAVAAQYLNGIVVTGDGANITR